MMESTSEYRIEKVRRRVSIILVGGVRLHGDLFLQPSARYRVGPQDPHDLLNEPERFVPFAVDGHAMTLIAKDHIIRVQYEDPAADPSEDGAALAAVEVHFTDGSATAGMLRLETPAGRPRLLDYLNDASEPFLRLRNAAGSCLANRRQIAQVRHRGSSE